MYVRPKCTKRLIQSYLKRLALILLNLINFKKYKEGKTGKKNNHFAVEKERKYFMTIILL